MAVTAIRTMRREPAADWTLARLSAAAALSPDHFVHAFGAASGVSPHRFLAALRMEMAKRLLIDSSEPITSIGFSVGYDSIGTFTRTFTTMVGLPPSRFRRLADLNWFAALETHLAAAADGAAACGGSTNRIAGTLTAGDPAVAERFGLGLVGVFATTVPQGAPLAAAVLPCLGRFCFDAAAICGGAYVHAAAAMGALSPRGLLLPDAASLFVATARLANSPVADRCRIVELRLRPIRETDPPIVFALPLAFTARRG